MKNSKKIFFNYGTVGLMGEPAYKAASKFLKEYYEVGPPEVLLEYEPYVDKLAKEAAELLNAREDEITYIKNTTEGLILASESLPLKTGDEVLVWGGEYPATLIAWNKKKKDGIDVTIISGDNNQIEDLLLGAVGPKTKVVAVAWAQHYDGYLPDLSRIGGVCREKGIYFVVDGVQGVGVRQIDLKKTQVDILVCGGQKYMGAIIGLGFMYVRREIIKNLKDIKVGIRSVEKFDAHSYTIRNTARRFEDGTLNLLGVVALHAALKHINELGIEKIDEKGRALLEEFKTILTQNRITFINHERQSNILTIKVSDPAELANFLQGHAMYVRPFKDAIRISFTHASSIKDFERVVKMITVWLESHPQPQQDAIYARNLALTQ